MQDDKICRNVYTHKQKYLGLHCFYYEPARIRSQVTFIIIIAVIILIIIHFIIIIGTIIRPAGAVIVGVMVPVISVTFG